MPTYHYRCATCEQHVEVVQSMTDDPITECAACGGQMQKVLRPVGIVLKGSGFYRTDSRSAAKTATKSEPKAAAKESESKTAAKDAGSKNSTDSSSGKSSEAKSA